MDLSIVILNYYNKNLIKEFLKNLAELNLPYDYEIIVVDNASYDGIGEVLTKNFSAVKFIQSSKNGGFAAGNNLGIKQATGKYILICNPDLAILSDAVQCLYNYMEANPKVGLAGPRLINADKSIQPSCTSFPDWHLPLYRRTFLANSQRGKKWLADYLLADLDHYQNHLVPALFGACLMVRRSALEPVGLMDERYFMYMEDLDWSRRFWEQGYQVAYAGEAEVIHLHRRESATDHPWETLFSKTARYHIVSFLKYLKKFKGKSLPEVK
jgi:GT2 family glycosyltransferase